MINIILCGGTGTGMWPVSRTMYPKQFAAITGGLSTFQKTVLRNSKMFDELCISASSDNYFIAKHQLESVLTGEKVRYILEPAVKNTAPAIALACMGIDPEKIVAVTPADHIIADEKAYARLMSEAAEAALEDRIAAIGVPALKPVTEYGYFRTAESGNGALRIAEFHEKPSIENASLYVSDSSWWWNSGIYVFKAGVFLYELKTSSPALYEFARAAFEGGVKCRDNGASGLKVPADIMEKVESISIEKAVIENTGNIFAVTGDIGWNDLGSFDSLYSVLKKDRNGNTSEGNIIYSGSTNNLTISDNRKIAMVGVDDLIVVDTPDALLVSRKNASGELKEVVSLLQDEVPEITSFHTTVHRPWGTYTILDEGEGFKIKRIAVKPGKRLSLQKHAQRSEHWVVVSGTAVVQIDENMNTVQKNESIYVPVGSAHRLINEGMVDLIIIETQVGDYLGEDDIVRIEDDYKR